MTQEAEILNVDWYTAASGTVGIVQVRWGWGQKSTYIAPVEGKNQDEDIQHVIHWGAQFPNSHFDGAAHVSHMFAVQDALDYLGRKIDEEKKEKS